MTPRAWFALVATATVLSDAAAVGQQATKGTLRLTRDGFGTSPELDAALSPAEFAAVEDQMWTNAQFVRSVELYNQGSNLHGTGNRDEAAQLYRASIKAFPLAQAYNNLGNLLERWEDSRASYELGLLHSVPGSEVRADSLANLALSYERHGGGTFTSLDTASHLAKRALAISPLHLGANYNLGIVYEKQADLDRAAEVYGKVLSIAPRHVGALMNSANIHHRRNELVKSLEFQRVGDGRVGGVGWGRGVFLLF